MRKYQLFTLSLQGYLDQGHVRGGTPFSILESQPLAQVTLHLADEKICDLLGVVYLVVTLRIHVAKTKTARKLNTAISHNVVTRASDSDPLQNKLPKVTPPP